MEVGMLGGPAYAILIMSGLKAMTTINEITSEAMYPDFIELREGGKVLSVTNRKVAAGGGDAPTPEAACRSRALSSKTTGARPIDSRPRASRSLGLRRAIFFRVGVRVGV